MFIEMSLSFKLYALREKFPYSEYFWSECGEIRANGHFLRGYIYIYVGINVNKKSNFKFFFFFGSIFKMLRFFMKRFREM